MSSDIKKRDMINELTEILDSGDLTKAVIFYDETLGKYPECSEILSLRNGIIVRIRKAISEVTGKEGIDALAKFSKSPEIAHLDVGNGCNLRCVYCWEATRPEHLNVVALPTEELKKKLIWMKDIGVKKARISGFGEVTIMPNWAEVVRFAQELGLKTGLITNLSKRLSEKEIEVLAGVDEITISVDTLNEEKSAEIRKGLRIEVLKDNLRALRLKKPYPSAPIIGWNSVTMAETLDDLAQLVEEGIEFGAHGFMFNSMFVLQGLKGATPIGFLPPAGILYAKECLLRAQKIAKDAGRYCIIDAALYDLIMGNNQVKNKCNTAPSGVVIGKSNQSHYLEGYFEPVRPGNTRLCLHPWNHLTLTGKTEVAVCCEVGGVELPAENTYSSGPLFELKKGLLTGNLAQNCQKCRLAPEVSVEAQQYNVLKLYRKTGNSPS